MDPRPCARRMVCYVIAMAAALLAPAAVQAGMLLAPGVLAAEHAHIAMSCVLAATVVAVPALLQRLIGHDVPARTHAPAHGRGV